jgi:hypothetical protein
MAVEVGKDHDAWCNKCSLVLAHVVVSMKGTRAHRVECKTCSDVHAYRKSEPGSRARSTRPRKSEYEKAIEDRDLGTAVSYSMSSTYAKDDLINHAKFGVGVVLDVIDSRMLHVAFQAGSKRMLYGRTG